MTTYNKDQWMASFEGQLAILRPHLSERLLGALSLSAWHRHGKKGVDPVLAAKEASVALDRSQG